MENLKEEFASNEEFRNSVLSTVKDSGYQLYKSDEFDQVINNKAETLVQAKVSDALKNNHTKLEESVFNIIGEQKKQDEKSYDYAARHLQLLKEQNEELSEKIKGNVSGDELLKQQVEKLTKDSQLKAEEYANTIALKEAELSKAKKQFMFDTEIKNLKFDSSLPKELIDAQIELIKQNVLNNSKIDNDKFLLTGEDGNVLTDPNKAHNAFQLGDYLHGKFSKYLHQDNASGTGTKPNGERRIKTDNDAETYIRSKNPRNSQDVTRFAKEYARSKGLNHMTDPTIGKARRAINSEFSD